MHTTALKGVMPNTLIIGAQKCGTTAMYHFLKQHPEVFMSEEKEPHFFSFENEEITFNGPRSTRVSRYWNTRRTKLTDYLALFSEVNSEKVIGEASPLYLYVPKSCHTIARYIPNAKLIVILRNPVDRAFSNFCHAVRNAHEPILDFEKAINMEEKRTQKAWGSEWYYKQLGLYHDQLKRYLNLFPRNQIKVILFEELAKNPISTMQEVYSYLGVESTFQPTLANINPNTGVPRDTLINRILQWMICQIPRDHRLSRGIRRLQPWSDYPVASLSMRNKLVGYFREDILRLETLIEKDLSSWLEVDAPIVGHASGS
jgi:hypothetical protein